MPFEQSQIGKWLEGVRLARKLSRSKASLGSGIPEKQIQRWEIEGVSAPAEGFLSLVAWYGAADELLEWLRVTRPAGQGASYVNQEGATRARRVAEPAPLEKFTAVPRSERKKRRKAR